MAKALIKVESNFADLLSDFKAFAGEVTEITEEAAAAQMEVIELAMKKNWVSMVPWGHANSYVYDSIGYNVAIGTNRADVVGSVGVFHIDTIRAKHNYDQPIPLVGGFTKKKPNAPQLAYWAEFGFLDWNKKQKEGIPFMGNAFYATVHEQDRAFADTFFYRMNRMLT